MDPVEFWKLVDWFGLTQLELETVKANVTVRRWQCPAAESKKEYQIFTAELFKKKDLRIFAGLTRLVTDLREEKAQEMMEEQNEQQRKLLKRKATDDLLACLQVQID